MRTALKRGNISDYTGNRTAPARIAALGLQRRGQQERNNPAIDNSIRQKGMITAIEPQISDSGRYSVTETCAILGINRRTLQKYTESCLIKCGYRKTNFRKFYLGKEIIRFWRAQM